ncbi:unnamed protein product, partial [Allacma fusca]
MAKRMRLIPEAFYNLIVNDSNHGNDSTSAILDSKDFTDDVKQVLYGEHARSLRQKKYYEDNKPLLIKMIDKNSEHSNRNPAHQERHVRPRVNPIRRQQQPSNYPAIIEPHIRQQLSNYLAEIEPPFGQHVNYPAEIEPPVGQHSNYPAEIEPSIEQEAHCSNFTQENELPVRVQDVPRVYPGMNTRTPAVKRNFIPDYFDTPFPKRRIFTKQSEPQWVDTRTKAEKRSFIPDYTDTPFPKRRL